MSRLKNAVSKFFEIKKEIGSVNLILASKTVESSFLLDFIKETGHLQYGENYASELKKWDGILPQIKGIELSFLGTFQSGNLKKMVKYCAKVQSASSLKHLLTIKEEAKKHNKDVKVYAQINIGEEASKSGFNLSDIKPEELSLFDGLMCIPPEGKNPAQYFKKMKEIKEISGVKNLSMGMSLDYKLAIKEGATEVRIGSLIFGERKNKI